MSIETALVSLLTGNAPINSLIVGRVHPEIFPENGVLPLLVYVEVTTNQMLAHDGGSGLFLANYQLDCWAATHDETVSLRDLITNLLDGYSGTIGGIKFDLIKVAGVRGDPDRDLRMSRKIIDLRLVYSEA